MNVENITGFGGHTAEQVQELQKALTLGSEYATQTPGTLTGGAALAVEDLNRTLKLVTHSMEHLKLWKDVMKDKATQTVHEYNLQNSYGKETSPFFAMGGTPTATDAEYNRDIAIVKYLGTQGQVNHNLTLIQAAHGPVVAREVKNKTIELLSKNERSMIDADSDIQALEYDGVDKLIRSRESQAKFKATAMAGYEEEGVEDTVIIDNEGQAIDEDVLEDACLRAVNNYGMPMDMYLSTTDHSQFSKAFFAKQRTTPGERLAAGNLVKEFNGTLNFKFKPSVFKRPRIAPLAIATSASAAPTVANVTTPVEAASKFKAADAGTYLYKVSAVYADGETLPSAEFSATVAAGDKVRAEVSFTGSPLYLNVFRSELAAASGSKVRFIGRIAAGTSAAARDLDLNARVPGSSRAYLLMHDVDVLCWRQLGSMIKYDLAVTDTSYRWLQLLYGMMVIPAPRKNVIIDNIRSREVAE